MIFQYKSKQLEWFKIAINAELTIPSYYCGGVWCTKQGGSKWRQNSIALKKSICNIFYVCCFEVLISFLQVFWIQSSWFFMHSAIFFAYHLLTVIMIMTGVIMTMKGVIMTTKGVVMTTTGVMMTMKRRKIFLLEISRLPSIYWKKKMISEMLNLFCSLIWRRVKDYLCRHYKNTGSNEDVLVLPKNVESTWYNKKKIGMMIKFTNR